MRNWSDTLKVSKKDEVKLKACSIIELSYAEKEKMKVWGNHWDQKADKDSKWFLYLQFNL